MFKSVNNLFSKRVRLIQDEVALKSKIDIVLTTFVKEKIKGSGEVKYELSYTLDRGIIKIHTDNKLIAQEIALRTKQIEDQLRINEVEFKKILI